MGREIPNLVELHLLVFEEDIEAYISWINDSGKFLNGGQAFNTLLREAGIIEP